MAIMGYSADAIWNDQKTESKGDLPVNSSMEIKDLKKSRLCVKWLFFQAEKDSVRVEGVDIMPLKLWENVRKKKV